MNSSLFDPNNHVPEVSPDDGWGDAEGALPQTVAAVSVLPPRRSVTDRPPPAAGPSEEPGLRIEANLTRVESAESPQRLEVQEIGSDDVVRLDQTDPAPPKVARQFTFHERQASESTRKKTGHNWGLGHRHPTRWIVGSGVAVAVIVILTLVLLPFINSPNAARAGPVRQLAIEEKIEGLEAMNLLLEKQPEALRIFRAFATASHADEVIPLARDGAAMERILRDRWQPLPVSKQWVPSSDSGWSVMDLAGHPCGLLEGNYPDSSRFTAYFTNDDDRLMLDWKATTGFGTASFSQLEESAGDASEIRGEISSADFYNAVWPEADYQSYRLISPDGEISIWCYARRGEAANTAIDPLLRKGEIVGEAVASRKITLRLERGPSGALANQWLIGEMLHLNWVSP